LSSIHPHAEEARDTRKGAHADACPSAGWHLVGPMHIEKQAGVER
jgi:hypothetical protein